MSIRISPGADRPLERQPSLARTRSLARNASN
jgi:hypothetical protein